MDLISNEQGALGRGQHTMVDTSGTGGHNTAEG